MALSRGRHLIEYIVLMADGIIGRYSKASVMTVDDARHDGHHAVAEPQPHRQRDVHGRLGCGSGDSHHAMIIG